MVWDGVSVFSVEVHRSEVCAVGHIPSDTRLMSYTLSTHFSARSTPTPLVPWLLPTQKNLYLESFPVMCLAEAPLHLTSCTQQRSTFLLVMVSTISLDLPLMVPMFQEAILNNAGVKCSMADDLYQWYELVEYAKETIGVNGKSYTVTLKKIFASPRSKYRTPFYNSHFLHKIGKNIF